LATTEVGETEQPERAIVTGGPELSTVNWRYLLTMAVTWKVPRLPRLFASPPYVPVTVPEP
jgi:hypothetical protein